MAKTNQDGDAGIVNPKQMETENSNKGITKANQVEAGQVLDRYVLPNASKWWLANSHKGFAKPRQVLAGIAKTQ